MSRKKKSNWTRAFLSTKQPHFPFSFHSILERKLFDGSREKLLGPHHLFSFLPTQLNILQQAFFPIFSPKFSIHPISPPNKHTLKDTVYQIQVSSYSKQKLDKKNLVMCHKLPKYFVVGNPFLLSHPHIHQFHGIYEVDGRFTLVS